MSINRMMGLALLAGGSGLWEAPDLYFTAPPRISPNGGTRSGAAAAKRAARKRRNVAARSRK